jgi:glycosyltransferase involved in cell wall biosynthesis
MDRSAWTDRASRGDFSGTLLFGSGLVVAAGLNFILFSTMGRMLAPSLFGTLGVFIAALFAVTGPVNTLSGGTEMFAALHDRFPRGRRRLWAPAIGLVLWGATMLARSPTVRSAGWFALGASANLLLAWNRGALTGLGRFAFVGATFVVDGVARLGISVLLVAIGLGLEGASAGLVLGMIVALLLTEAVLPRMAAGTRQPLGREVWLALLGLFALGLTQIVDVFAIRLTNPSRAGSYVAAASLARMALFSQIPAAAYALRRAAIEGPRRALPRTILLASGPGLLAIGVLELVPHQLLSIAYGDRYLASVGTLRILGAAMLLGGLATVAAQLLMGMRSTAWVWSVLPVAVLGSGAIIGLAHAPTSVAVFSVAIQGTVLITLLVPVWSAVRARPPGPERLLILNWRDTRHPQGGGSEVYVERVARRLAAGGREVTVFCGAHAGAPTEEIVDGVRFVRRGGWRTVYAWAFVSHLFGRLGPHDVVVDVKNGIPFFAPLYCRRPVVSLVHHVHREQWGMNFSSGWARFGWWVESGLSPRVYARSRHIVVSEATRQEVAALGIPIASIDIVHNGAEPTMPTSPKADAPTILSLGRLVPHKRVEFVLDAAAKLRKDVPDLRVVVAGHGPWHPRLVAHADRLGIADAVTFAGWVDEGTKLQLLQGAWVLGMPSVKEGWGLAVMEAAACGVPAVAFRVGGLEESIEDGRTGLLVDDEEAFTEALRRLLLDRALRERLGAEAARRARAYSWERTAERFDVVLRDVLSPDGAVVVLEPQPAAEV